MTEPVAAEVGRDFIRDIIQADLDQGKYKEIVTRFPPEPNGYLHIGHAKSIALNFGIAQEFPGRCHLRFDDTNPVKEEQEYIDSIQADVRWLGFDWGKNLFFASDYFDRLYEWAEKLIRDGLAYVDDQTQEEIRTSRGTLTEPGKNSPFRDRSVEENLDLFRRMKAGEFPNGARVLRAKIDMAAGNINLRDPVLYRILHAHHPRTGTKWSIYPSYDYAHGQSDAIEGITHSICTLEFEDHRPLYDWFIEKLPVPSQPHQYEFARLNLTYTLLSKRVLTQLVRDGHVAGWDDPRMPTMAGMRRRGVPPAALREFVKRIGVAKANSVVDVGMLEFCIREELNRTSQRRMGVLRPLKVVIENYPEGQTEELEAINHPDDPSAGTRKITFGRELYIEQDDFMENPPKKFFRLSPGNEVRLRYAYFVKCTGVIKNDKGEVVELRCTYDPATKGGNAPDGRKVKATMHWLPAATSVPAEIRIYNQLFSNPSPDASNFAADLNPNSLEILSDARIEASVAESNSTEPMQFERQGYFVRDKDSTPGKPVFSRTIGLRDTFAKEVAKGEPPRQGKSNETAPQQGEVSEASTPVGKGRAIPGDSPLASVLSDVQRAISVGLYYPALLAALTLPEICVGLTLDAKDFVKKSHYVDFVNRYTTPSSLGTDGENCYHLRGGLVHRGNLAGHPYVGCTHVIFVSPQARATMHALSLVVGEKQAAMFDLVLFCNEMITAVQRWYEKHHADAKVEANMKNLIRFCPDGLAPFVKGPIVASGS
ncbi:glutamine--tRNA ligase/YqeY domain fusion protein [Bradyrhizobium tunisiense]|uniref:glutamine--tRNA ligase/YqeY domain fusion protein n=1 Tax=Bradyrhizobium tunisiense TaxID=3278709 RepID=UPI0035D9E6EB